MTKSTTGLKPFNVAERRLGHESPLLCLSSYMYMGDRKFISSYIFFPKRHILRPQNLQDLPGHIYLYPATQLCNLCNIFYIFGTSNNGDAPILGPLCNKLRSLSADVAALSVWTPLTAAIFPSTPHVANGKRLLPFIARGI